MSEQGRRIRRTIEGILEQCAAGGYAPEPSYVESVSGGLWGVRWGSWNGFALEVDEADERITRFYRLGLDREVRALSAVFLSGTAARPADLPTESPWAFIFGSQYVSAGWLHFSRELTERLAETPAFELAPAPVELSPQELTVCLARLAAKGFDLGRYLV